MCGLIGCAGVEPQSSRAWLQGARDTLNHRGPDDAGEWWSNDGRVGLGHRRLAIFDLTPSGHQPMHFPEHGLSIIFNGEIYNFRELRKDLEHCGYTFGSHCDTEVLLAAYAAWGDGCLEKLNGMFAFAIYDAPRQRLLIARDRAGEKPLFYWDQGDTIFFASELKALMANPALPRRIDRESLDCFLTAGYVPRERCILEGFKKLPPAHALCFDLRDGSKRLWQYWTLPEYAEEVSVSEPGLLDELEVLIERAVVRQLNADVPVGVLLSGGVDSSLITAMAVRHSNRVNTFTIGFPGYGQLDETPHARRISRHFGTHHTELMAEPASADLIPLLARQFDEPIADTAMIPNYLVSRLVREQCTVALGGDGGDELFGGYTRFSQLLRLQRAARHIPPLARRRLAGGAEKFLPVGFVGRNYLRVLDTEFNTSLPFVASVFDAGTRRDLMRGYEPWPTVGEHVFQGCVPASQDLIQRATRMEFSTYMPDYILVKVDRSSMLNSLEVRAPLLDRDLVEFAFARVPSHLKATEHQTKIILKRLTARLLPEDFDRDRKQGFTVPLSQWLRSGPFRELFWDVLNSSDIIFDRGTVQTLLRGQDRGLKVGTRLFALVQFELWRRAYAVTF
jgi:asparagine synthase (glutamine-hydrolysing)